MSWAYFIIPAVLIIVGFVAWKMVRENKALSKQQHDSMDGRERFNQPEATNQGSSVRNFNGFSG